MTPEQVKAIADAVLYEGYLLYPYRHSAIKNRQRWTFGVVYPRAYREERGGIEPWTMRTECLLKANSGATLDVTARFLHLLTRSSIGGEASDLALEAWDEATERDVEAPALALDALAGSPRRIAIAFPGGRFVEQSAGAAAITRAQRPIFGAATIGAEPVVGDVGDAQLFKVSVLIENTSPVAKQEPERRDGVPLQAFVSTHTILRVHGGAFVSLMDPPDALRDAARHCRNEGTWPVLAGDEGERDVVLSSPIILYDYPQIAPESAGALFDGTEIDEILTLRILTLTDAERAEMRQGDDRAREILERTEALTPDQLMKLHGTIRSLRPVERGGGA